MLLAGRPDLATHRSRSLSTALLHTNLASMTMTNDGEGKGPQLLRSTHHIALLCGDRGLQACVPSLGRDATSPWSRLTSPRLHACRRSPSRPCAVAPHFFLASFVTLNLKKMMSLSLTW